MFRSSAQNEPLERGRVKSIFGIKPSGVQAMSVRKCSLLSCHGKMIKNELTGNYENKTSVHFGECCIVSPRTATYVKPSTHFCNL